MAVSPVELPSPLERCRKEDRQPHWLTRLLRKVLGYPPLPMPVKGEQWMSEYSGDIERVSDVRVTSNGILVVEVQQWYASCWSLPSCIYGLSAWQGRIASHRRVRCVGFTDQ